MTAGRKEVDIRTEMGAALGYVQTENSGYIGVGMLPQVPMTMNKSRKSILRNASIGLNAHKIPKHCTVVYNTMRKQLHKVVIGILSGIFA